MRYVRPAYVSSGSCSRSTPSMKRLIRSSRRINFASIQTRRGVSHARVMKRLSSSTPMSASTSSGHVPALALVRVCARALNRFAIVRLRQPAMGSRYHLCLNRNRLRVLGCDPRCLVTSRRWLRHQPLDRCTARCCCTQGRHQRPQSTKRLRASFRPWAAICLHDYRAVLQKHGLARRSQFTGGPPHEPFGGRSL